MRRLPHRQQWPVVAPLAVIASGVALLSPSPAQAVDGTRIRTPVVWYDVPCMTVVDRSIDSVVTVPYAIPFEDTEVTKDEVEDGRTHQFFAWCRDHDPTQVLPQWISEADVAAAEAQGLIDAGTVSGDAVLDNNGEWSGCFDRITTDDDRRAITFANAEVGVQWDTTGIAAGPWVIEAFTHDPPFSIWSPRMGVFAVVDEPAPEANGPAAAITNGEIVVPSGETTTISGCINAMEGTQIDLLWAGIGDAQWTVAMEGEPVRGAGFDLELLLPPELAGQAARVRIDAEDPQGRRTTAYMSEFVLVLPPGPACPDNDCEDTGIDETGDGSTTGGGTATSTAGDMATSSPSSGPGSTSTEASTDDGAEQAESRESGCGCATTPNSGPLSLALLPWLLLCLRPRRERPSTAARV